MPKKYSQKFKSEVLEYEKLFGPVQASTRYSIPRMTIKRWKDSIVTNVTSNVTSNVTPDLEIGPGDDDLFQLDRIDIEEINQDFQDKKINPEIEILLKAFRRRISTYKQSGAKGLLKELDHILSLF
jgi:hypothetical protein